MNKTIPIITVIIIVFGLYIAFPKDTEVQVQSQVENGISPNDVYDIGINSSIYKSLNKARKIKEINIRAINRSYERSGLKPNEYLEVYQFTAICCILYFCDTVEIIIDPYSGDILDQHLWR